jgi:STE24 endopeptidase
MEFSNFSYLFLIFLALWLVISLWLNYRQILAAQLNQNNIPTEFKTIISENDAKKAADYTIAKLKVNNLELIFGAILLLVWTIFGGLEFLNQVLNNIFNANNPIIFGAIVIISFSIISSILDLPFNIYRTFVLETKFGFNNTTIKTFITDMIKTLVLALILGVPLIMLILYLMGQMGELWWLWTWVVLSIFSLLMMWIYPSFIAPIFNKFEKLEAGELNDKITELLHKTGFKSNGLFVMDGSKRSSHGNAYFTGFGQNKRIVFFDTLLKGMENNEVLAVLAHELGHFKHKHIIKQIIISFISTFIALFILGLLIGESWFYTSLGVESINNHNALLLFMLVAPVFSFLIAPLLNLSSRKHEYEADNFAVKHTSGNNLISALTKLYKDNAAILIPDKFYSIFYDSHPNAILRVANIKQNND